MRTLLVALLAFAALSARANTPEALHEKLVQLVERMNTVYGIEMNNLQVLSPMRSRHSNRSEGVIGRVSCVARRAVRCA